MGNHAVSQGAQRPEEPTASGSSTPSQAGETRTFAASDGWVWRNSHAPYFAWHTILPPTATKLLAGFRATAADKQDWFHTRAAELADELEAAIKLASEQAHKRSAA